MFLCLLNTDGTPVSDVERGRYAARIHTLAKASEVASDHVECVDAGEFVAFVAPALVPMRPLWGGRQGLVGVGNVRLDHRDDVRRWGRVADADASDINLVLSAIEARGTGCLRDALGDFALVVWEPRTRTLTAARDAFGVKTLFIGQRGRLLVLSSHLELVHDSETLDEEYVADFLLAGDPGSARTIWADSSAISQGSTLTVRDGKQTIDRFWNPYDFEPTAEGNGCARAEEFLALFRDAVCTRLEPNGQTWAELSGGLDSSSIVSMAQTVLDEGKISKGIAGTVSIVDELGSGNERHFSDLVVQRFRLSNATVMNPWPWQDDGHPPPKTDEPRTHYPFFARDRQICNIVRGAGAQVLLSGFGSDHYLYGNRLFIADLVARGQVVRACRELAQWAVLEQRSFWKGLLSDGGAPFFPALNPQRIPSIHTVPDWIDPAFAKRLSLRARLPVLREARALRGHKFSQCIASGMQEVVRWLPRGSFEEGLELRYPFFYRPLVEFGLRLPPSMRAQPLAPKWILREAMNGILPEPIRTRSGKGGIDARLNWGFLQERKRILAALFESPLTSRRIIRVDRLKAAVGQTSDGRIESIATLLPALSLATWLFVRSDRWIVGSNTEIASHVTHQQRTAQSA